MKTVKIGISIFLLGICTNALIAQNLLSGEIQNWTNGEAQLISIIDGPIQIGSINNKGEFKINLHNNVVNVFKQKVEPTDKNTASLQSNSLTIKRAFGCINDSIAVKNADQAVIKLSNYGLFTLADLANKKKYGEFIIAGSKDFANSYISFGQKDAETGYFVDFYFVEEPAMVKGKCKVTKYTGNSEESFLKTVIYNLNFKQGWNIVTYKIEKIYNTEGGKNLPQIISYNTLNNMPDKIKYIFFN